MPFLIQHKCPNCGSNLNHDEINSKYNCGYCGNSYEMANINLEDVYAKTFEDFKKKKYKLSEEGFSYLVSKEPYNAIYWRGKLLSFLSLSDEKDIFATEFKHSSAALSSLMKKVPKSCENYLKKIVEGIDLKNESDSIEEKCNLLKESIDKRNAEISKVRGTEVNNIIPVLIIIGSLIVMGIFEFFCYAMDVAFYYYLIWFVVFLIPIVIALIETISKRNYVKEESERLSEIIRKQRVELEISEEELRKVRDKKAEFIKELKELRKALYQEYNFNPNIMPEISSSSSRIDDSEALEDIDHCPNCAAKLVLDKDKSLYLCPSCGATFDYNYMIDFLWIDRAYNALSKGYFAEAKSEFLKILEVRPGDAVALNGLVLSTMNIKVIVNPNATNVIEAFGYIDKYLPNIPDINKPYFEGLRQYEKLKNDIKTKNQLIDKASEAVLDKTKEIASLKNQKLLLDDELKAKIDKINRECDLVTRPLEIVAAKKSYENSKLKYDELIIAAEASKTELQKEVDKAKREEQKSAKVASDFLESLSSSKPSYDKYTF